jgi:hypothetical protein
MATASVSPVVGYYSAVIFVFFFGSSTLLSALSTELAVAAAGLSYRSFLYSSNFWLTVGAVAIQSERTHRETVHDVFDHAVEAHIPSGNKGQMKSMT